MELVGGAIYGAGCLGHAGAYDWFLQTLGSLKGVKQGCDVVKCVLLKAPCGFSVSSEWEEIGRRLVGVMDKALVLKKTLKMMLKLKLQYFGHLLQRADSFEKTLMLGKIEGRRRGGRQNGWMASPTQWTRVWVNSRSWRWTGLRFMGSQRVEHD